jgi:hypothetical protein
MEIIVINSPDLIVSSYNIKVVPYKLYVKHISLLCRMNFIDPRTVKAEFWIDMLSNRQIGFERWLPIICGVMNCGSTFHCSNTAPLFCFTCKHVHLLLELGTSSPTVEIIWTDNNEKVTTIFNLKVIYESTNVVQ